MYRNAQKLDLKRGAAWFLGTNYCSEGMEFDQDSPKLRSIN